MLINCSTWHVHVNLSWILNRFDKPLKLVWHKHYISNSLNDFLHFHKCFRSNKSICSMCTCTNRYLIISKLWLIWRLFLSKYAWESTLIIIVKLGVFMIVQLCSNVPFTCVCYRELYNTIFTLSHPENDF